MLHEIRYAIRTLAKSPRFTLIVVLTLAIAIGANTAMFGILNTALLQPLPFSDPDRLVFGHTSWGGSSNFAPVSAPDYWDYRDQTSVFSSLAAIFVAAPEATVTGVEEPHRIATTTISVDLLPTLGVQPMLGRGFTSDEAEPGARAMIVSYGYWQSHLGGAREVIGHELILNGTPRLIVGVMSPDFRLPVEADVYLPMTDDPAAHVARRFHNWFLVGRLKDGVTLEEARAEVDVISGRLEQQYPDSNKDKALGLVPLHDALVSNDRPSLLALSAAVSLVLLIACANVAGLLLARASSRRRELALRLALGVSPGGLVRQYLIESAVVASAAAVAGLLLAGWIERLLLRVAPLDALGVREIPTDFTVLLFALGVSVATVLLSGLVPALRASRISPSASLTGAGRTTDARSGTRLRSALAAAQIALSLVLLTGTGLLVRSLYNLSRSDLGFNPHSLLTAEIELPDAGYPDSAACVRFHTALLEKVRAMPGVTGAGLINFLPVKSAANNTAIWPFGERPAQVVASNIAYMRSVMPGYFDAMGIPLLSGRDVSETDTREQPRVVVLNETLARSLFEGTDAVGRKVVIDVPGGEETAAEVVGVVGDVLIGGPGSDLDGAFYLPFPQATYSTMYLAIRTGGDPNLLGGPVRAAVRELDSQVPLSGVATMETIRGRSLSDHRVVTGLLIAFAGVAVFLAAIGLYGVLAFYVVGHTRELGVRMALGATRRGILTLVFRRAAVLLGAGVCAGVVGSILGAHLIRHLLFGVPASDPLTLVGAALLFAAVALIACLPPARRATRVDPVVALRCE